MKSTLILKSGMEKNYVLIGIACHLKEYRLCWALNEKLGLKLKRIEDLMVSPEGKRKEENRHPVFHYEEMKRDEQYFLVGNHGPSGELIEKKIHADYLIFIKDIAVKGGASLLISEIKKIEHVLTAFKIPLQKDTSLGQVLSDLELHLNEHNRKEKQKRLSESKS